MRKVQLARRAYLQTTKLRTVREVRAMEHVARLRECEEWVAVPAACEARDRPQEVEHDVVVGLPADPPAVPVSVVAVGGDLAATQLVFDEGGDGALGPFATDERGVHVCVSQSDRRGLAVWAWS